MNDSDFYTLIDFLCRRGLRRATQEASYRIVTDWDSGLKIVNIITGLQYFFFDFHVRATKMTSIWRSMFFMSDNGRTIKSKQLIKYQRKHASWALWDQFSLLIIIWCTNVFQCFKWWKFWIRRLHWIKSGRSSRKYKHKKKVHFLLQGWTSVISRMSR